MYVKNCVPVMLYDGDCVFCSAWIEKWRTAIGERICFAPYQEVISDYPQVSAKQCRQAVQLVLADSSVFSGAHAVFKAFSFVGKFNFFLWCYEYLPLFGWLAELAYQLVAHCRSFLSKFYGVPKCRV